MSTRPRRIACILAVPALSLLIAACSGGGSGYGYGGGGAAGSLAPPAVQSAAPSAAPVASSAGRGGEYGSGSGSSVAPSASDAMEIAVATGAAGAHLTGANGMTLYVFTKDSPNTSVCSDACASDWPPLIAAAGATPTAGDGVTGALTTFARADGTLQVAYGGKPLYYFAADQAAGDTNGQGVNDVWFIAQP